MLGRGKSPLLAARILFDPQDELTAAEIRTLASAIGSVFVGSVVSCSNDADPDQRDALFDGTTELEIISAGLSFIVRGLVPLDAATMSIYEKVIGFDDKASLDVATLNTLVIEPGPLIRSSIALPPIVRALASLTAELSALQNTRAILWNSSGNLIEPGLFRKQVTQWNTDHIFPVAALSRLYKDQYGSLCTQGLSVYIGQELEIEQATLIRLSDRQSLMIIRLVEWLIANGPVMKTIHLTSEEFGGLEIRRSASGSHALVRLATTIY
ncbi:hypothetical protein GRI91_03710 [Altererythrobacter endophyticus]|uniref:DUF4261 domain-containing protein n=2 Tax=Altericroceibacterium endophyticum TaxID=1808508 RepID=A0A6I4T1M6_9SPHN|nr:hypothetical protein [Altericroceibacterium endophyticum]